MLGHRAEKDEELGYEYHINDLHFFSYLIGSFIGIWTVGPRDRNCYDSMANSGENSGLLVTKFLWAAYGNLGFLLTVSSGLRIAKERFFNWMSRWA